MKRATVSIPTEPKIYHIVHVDRLASIVADGYLWCDAEIARRDPPGTTIGMSDIKLRRLNELTLDSHPELHVGDCVPFYFCPRSVMLYLIYKGITRIAYRGGQGPIIHLEADLRQTVAWANTQGQRWAFTLSNAGSSTSRIGVICHSWTRLTGTRYRPALVGVPGWQTSGVLDRAAISMGVGYTGRSVVAQDLRSVEAALQAAPHKPRVAIKPEWYY